MIDHHQLAQVLLIQILREYSEFSFIQVLFYERKSRQRFLRTFLCVPCKWSDATCRWLYPSMCPMSQHEWHRMSVQVQICLWTFPRTWCLNLSLINPKLADSRVLFPNPRSAFLLRPSYTVGMVSMTSPNTGAFTNLKQRIYFILTSFCRARYLDAFRSLHTGRYSQHILNHRLYIASVRCIYKDSCRFTYPLVASGAFWTNLFFKSCIVVSTLLQLRIFQIHRGISFCTQHV